MRINYQFAFKALSIFYFVLQLTPRVAYGDDQAPQRVRISGKVMTQKLVRSVTPEYPPEAKMAGTQGTVKLQIVVGINGHVQQIEILSGDRALARAAIEAVRQWEYQPTKYQGRLVEVITAVDVVFRRGDGGQMEIGNTSNEVGHVKSDLL